jgi:MFS family permease
MRAQLALSAGALGVGFTVMAAAPTILVAVVGAAIAGSGNGVQLVAARTFVQERTSQSWMAIVMGLQESIVEAAPGLGIVIGGSIAALASPRAALGVAGAASLLITVMFWIVLKPSETDPEPVSPLGPVDSLVVPATLTPREVGYEPSDAATASARGAGHESEPGS